MAIEIFLQIDTYNQYVSCKVIDVCRVEELQKKKTSPVTASIAFNFITNS